jgi:transcriptional regulator with XRE-family HTH domain
MAKHIHASALDLAATLAQARTASGLTQAELAARTGRTQSSISQIEAGRVEPNLSSLIELARAVGLEVRLIPQSAVPAVESILNSGPGAAASKPLYTIS